MTFEFVRLFLAINIGLEFLHRLVTAAKLRFIEFHHRDQADCITDFILEELNL